MESNKIWLQELNLSSEDYSAWAKLTPKGMSVAFWAIINDKLDSAKFLEWSKKHYNLPALKKDFLYQPTDQNFWKSIQSVANWSPELVPIKEWDGVLYIACIEPNEEIGWSFPVKYVLADAKDLAHYWHELNNPIKNSAPEPVISAPAPAPETTPQPVVQTPTPESVVAEPVVAEPVVAEPAPPTLQPEVTAEAPANDSPAGLSFDIPSFKNESSSADTSDAPAGLNLNFDLPSAEAPTPVEPVADSAPTLEIPEGMGAVTPAPEPTPSPAPTPSLDVSVEPPSLELPDQPTLEMPEQPPAPVAQEPEAPPTLELPDTPQPQAEPEVVASLRHTANSDDSDAQTIFNELHAHFKACMVLIMVGEKLKVWLHDKNLTPKNESSFQEFNISKPCIFRIVKTTGHPYHGPMSNNEINDDFFINWNYAELPPHITMTPIKYDTHVVGMLLCIGESSANTLQALSLAEQCTEKLKPIIEKKQSGAA